MPKKIYKNFADSGEDFLMLYYDEASEVEKDMNSKELFLFLQYCINNSSNKKVVRKAFLQSVQTRLKNIAFTNEEKKIYGKTEFTHNYGIDMFASMAIKEYVKTQLKIYKQYNLIDYTTRKKGRYTYLSITLTEKGSRVK